MSHPAGQSSCLLFQSVQTQPKRLGFPWCQREGFVGQVGYQLRVIR